MALAWVWNGKGRIMGWDGMGWDCQSVSQSVSVIQSQSVQQPVLLYGDGDGEAARASGQEGNVCVWRMAQLHARR